MKQQYTISNDAIKKILAKYNLGNFNSFAPIKTGLINPVFLINNTYVLRIDKSDHLKNVAGHDTRFEREAFLYNLLLKKSIPVPQCLGFDWSGEIIPEKYILISYVPGIPLSQIFKNLDKKSQQKISFQMGKILKEIHKITPDDLNGSELFNPKTDWKKLYEKEFSFYLQEAIREKYFSLEIEEEIKKIFQQFQTQIPDLDSKLTLVHGDFSAGNIQINKGNIVGIFDFEWAHIGDPLWDLQKLPINFQLGNSFQKDSFLQGYGVKQFTDEELIRLKTYCFHQGIWEIRATKTQLFPFGEKEIKEGNQLIKSTLQVVFRAS